jgi:urease gamma subunit
MKIAYVAGPYRGRSKNKLISYLQRQINIRRAAKVAKWAWKRGYAVICPHLNSRNFDGLTTDLMFLNSGKEILKRCDVMILVPGWRQSEGTIDEIQFARWQGIIIRKYERLVREAENLGER